MRNWPVYKDFVALCRKGVISDIKDFHDRRLLPRLLSPSADPFGYYKIMAAAYMEIRSLYIPDPVTAWFQEIAIKNHQLK
jgi:hypothetical protein